jgi:hypothetical protein
VFIDGREIWQQSETSDIEAEARQKLLAPWVETESVWDSEYNETAKRLVLRHVTHVDYWENPSWQQAEQDRIREHNRQVLARKKR